MGLRDHLASEVQGAFGLAVAARQPAQCGTENGGRSEAAVSVDRQGSGHRDGGLGDAAAQLDDLAEADLEQSRGCLVAKSRERIDRVAKSCGRELEAAGE